MEILDNPWVIGIGGGVLSGFFVAIATQLFLGKREKREYSQKVRRANQEVVYAIRPGISEGHLPSAEIVRSLINSTARRLGVIADDLYPPEQIAEELTKEIMDSVFLSSAKKLEYCDSLTKITESRSAAVCDSESVRHVPAADASFAAYREQAIRLVSLLLGVMTSLISATLVIRSDSLGVTGSDFEKLLLPTVAATLSVVLGYLSRQVWSRLQGNSKSRASGATGTLCPDCNEPLGPFEEQCRLCGFRWKDRNKSSDT